MFDQDFSGLIVTGSTTLEQQQTAWNAVFTEYCGLIQSKSYNEIFETTKTINELEATIELIEEACDLLEISTDQPLIIEILCNLGFNPGKEINVQLLRSRSKRLRTTMAQKIAHYETLMQDRKEISRETFYDDLIAISRWQGHDINESEVMVAKFCQLLKRYTEYLEKVEMKNLKVA